jgi:hypothetical protein
MPTLCETVSNGSRMTRPTVAFWTAIWVVAVGSIGCTPSGIAEGLRRDTAARIKLGMSSAEVLGALGSPLSDGNNPPDGTTRRLVYARSAGASFGNSHLMASGLDCAVLIEEDAVVSAHIIDTKRDVMCRCERARCPVDWSSPCLASLPVVSAKRSSQ